MAKRHNMAFELGWRNEEDMAGFEPLDMFGRPRFTGDFRNKRYIEAYGNYSGGYRPSGPRPLMSLRPQFRNFEPMYPFPMGRGMPPRGPPPRRLAHDDQAVKYLLRCGVPKESVKNLPSDCLQLIEPHYCGLCGFGFDSFPTSRLHYVSKNHLKAQKRWMSQKSEMGQQKEAPLKSRDLYCELCDVHITSKVHADSHYTGKPHRAIVEGRKNPKNPVLLQKIMKGRLEQLIRREKKHLKLTPDGETPQDTKIESTSQSQSEFYCDICKTSMTCAEQMTMHLNGKRHLNKEKQHILKVMKGEIKEPTSTEKQEQNNEVVVEEKEEVTQPTTDENPSETNQENPDWVDGTGVWEDN